MMTATQVKERPILFSGAMIQAILEGRKTQTRRIIKLPSWSTQNWDDFEVYENNSVETICASTGCSADILCPYGKKGDWFWVRETWLQSPADGSYWYKADNHEEGLAKVYNYRWKPSIHMPRSASRITLEITGIRVEEVQNISEEDAIAEGAKRFDNLPSIHPYGQDPRWSMEEAPPSTDYCLNSARLAFANYWNKLNADRGYPWESNPWVWVIEFQKVDPA